MGGLHVCMSGGCMQLSLLSLAGTAAGHRDLQPAALHLACPPQPGKASTRPQR